MAADATRSVRRTCLAAIALLLAAMPAAAAADEQNQPPPRPAPDFFFGQPSGSLGVRGSWIFQRAGSDLFDFVQQQLTIDKGDFNMPAFALDLGVALGERMEVVAGLELSRATRRSEYRAFVDNNELPIEQETTLREANLSGSLKVWLTPRGRRVGQLAWVPRTFAPYVGAGAGALWYQFGQVGDFVDFVDLSVFPDVFDTRGWTPSAHVFGGTDVRLWRRLFLTMEGRYLWAAGPLGRDFIDFDPIDLAGFRLSAGINVQF